MTLLAFLARPTRRAARQVAESLSPAERSRIVRVLEKRISADRGRLARLEGRR